MNLCRYITVLLLALLVVPVATAITEIQGEAIRDVDLVEDAPGRSVRLERAAGESLVESLENEEIRLLLIIPILGSLVIVMRYLIGVSTFGVFGPIIIGISILQMGVFHGTYIYFVLFLVGLVIKLPMRKLNLPVVSEVAIIIFALSGSILTFWILAGVNSLEVQVVFPLVITSYVIERFTRTFEIKGPTEALQKLATTFIVAFALSYVGALLQQVSTPLLAGIFAAAFVWTVLASKYLGLRMSEYVRFNVWGASREK